MAKKRIKIAKYTKEKNAEAWAKYNAEQAKIKYSLPNNMMYILKECWQGARQLLLIMIAILIADLIINFTAVFIDKYVIEFALGTSSRVRLGIICIALIAVQQLAIVIDNSGNIFATYTAKFRLSAHLYGKLMKKKMDTDYENTENTKLGDMLHKADDGVNMSIIQIS